MSDYRSVGRQWELLLRRSFDREVWDRSKQLYSFLTMRCRFIAHYDQAGFYAAQMGTPDRRIHFLCRMRDVLVDEQNRPTPAYEEDADLFAAMLAALNRHWERAMDDQREAHLAGLRDHRARLDAEIARLEAP